MARLLAAKRRRVQMFRPVRGEPMLAVGRVAAPAGADPCAGPGRAGRSATDPPRRPRREFEKFVHASAPWLRLRPQLSIARAKARVNANSVHSVQKRVAMPRDG